MLKGQYFVFVLKKENHTMYQYINVSMCLKSNWYQNFWYHPSLVCPDVSAVNERATCFSEINIKFLCTIITLPLHGVENVDLFCHTLQALS